MMPVETMKASWRQSEGSGKQAILKSCQEVEEEEEEVEATAQEYSGRLFLARGQMWPWARAQRARDTHTQREYTLTCKS